MENNKKGIEGAVEKFDDRLNEVEGSFETLGTFDQQSFEEYQILSTLQTNPTLLIFIFFVLVIIFGFLFQEKRNDNMLTLNFVKLSSLHRHVDSLNCYKDIRALAIQIAGGHQSVLGKKLSEAEDIGALEDVIRIKEVEIKKRASDADIFFDAGPEEPVFELKTDEDLQELELEKEEQSVKDPEPIAPVAPLEELAPIEREFPPPTSE